jgi:RNA polymerase sigma factor (TIGR02999 family)
MGELTDLLTRWANGDRTAFEALLPRVYGELHHLARLHMNREREGHTLQPTALVSEAYLRLAGANGPGFASRAHFFGAAAHVMRRVLVDHARKKNAQKREAVIVTGADLDQLVDTIDVRSDLAALDDALNELAMIAPDKAQVVELRYFGGLSIEETGEYLDLSPATVKRYWTFARAWLFDRLTHGRNT